MEDNLTYLECKRFVLEDFWEWCVDYNQKGVENSRVVSDKNQSPYIGVVGLVGYNFIDCVDEWNYPFQVIYTYVVYIGLTEFEKGNDVFNRNELARLLKIHSIQECADRLDEENKEEFLNDIKMLGIE